MLGLMGSDPFPDRDPALVRSPRRLRSSLSSSSSPDASSSGSTSKLRNHFGARLEDRPRLLSLLVAEPGGPPAKSSPSSLPSPSLPPLSLSSTSSSSSSSSAPPPSPPSPLPLPTFSPRYPATLPLVLLSCADRFTVQRYRANTSPIPPRKDAVPRKDSASSRPPPASGTGRAILASSEKDFPSEMGGVHITLSCVIQYVCILRLVAS